MSFTTSAKKRVSQQLAKQNKDIQDIYSSININNSPYSKYKKYEKYQMDPVGFVRNELGMELWEKQEELLVALTQPPYRVLSPAAHSVGKTVCSAAAILWFAFSFPDSIVISTAPTERQVINALWRNVRAFNKIDPDIFRGAYKAEFHLAEHWYGIGFVPNNPDAMNGLHSASGNMLIIFDEAVGIDAPIWEAMQGLLNDDVRFLGIMNPTDTTSQAYLEYLSGNYVNIHISTLDHPNIAAELAGLPPPFPGAVRLNHFERMLKKWSDVIPKEMAGEGDLEFPPGSNIWYRPGPLALSRLLGKWPIQNGDSFFGELHLRNMFQEAGYYELRESKTRDASDQLLLQPYQIGIDVARSGQDFSVVSFRIEHEIVEHYRLNIGDFEALASVIYELVDAFSIKYELVKEDIPIVIDSTGMGIGLFDILRGDRYGLNATDLHFNEKAYDKEKYANVRCEMYAHAATLARENRLRINREIVSEYKHILSTQFLNCVYTYNSQNKYILEPKVKTRSRIGMSPDDSDAICMAFYPYIQRLTYVIEDM